MRRLLVGVLLNTVALALTATLVPQWLTAPPLESVQSALELLWAGLLLGLANAVVRPVLLLMTLPLTLLTLGLFALVVNTLVLLGVAGFSSLDTSGLGGAFGAALVLMVLNTVLHGFNPKRKPRPVARSRS